MKNIINKNGFTLIETMLYIALVGVVVGVFVDFGISISDIRSKASSIQKTNSDLLAVADFVTEQIRLAEDVLSPLPGNSGDILILKRPNSAVDLSIQIIDGVAYVREGAGNNVPISNDYINITQLLFENMSAINDKDNIKISLNGEYRYASSKAFSYNQSLETAVSLRR